MPASLFGDMEHGGSGGMSLQYPQSNSSSASSPNNNSGNGNNGGSLLDEDQRALQLALELSMLGLSDGTGSLGSLHQLAASVGCNDHLGMGGHLSHLLPSACSDLYGGGDLIPKKSQNMTECVPVPSSEHVAEIVGRQGCKIKALRAKTNTYIKTPVRGEEPVFVVTGRKEDVGAAKREILSAAEHFSQIRASRKGGVNGPSAPAPIPGQVTIQVRVPYRVVGLVVGPKGATIKRIQQQTHTYIVTPSREKDPVFEVTGLPENVQMAKREIEAHIAIRTGSFPSAEQSNSLFDSTDPTDILASLYKSGIGLDGLGQLGGAINSLSSSLSSVSNGFGAVGASMGGLAQNGGSVGSSSSGGGSLSSLSSLNGVGVGFSSKLLGQTGDFFPHQALTDLTFSLMDNTNTSGANTATSHNNTVTQAIISSSRSEDSYLFGGSGSGSSGPNSIEDGSHNKLSDLFATTTNNGAGSVGSSLWGSFDRDEGLGDSPTLETAPTSANLINLK